MAEYIEREKLLRDLEETVLFTAKTSSSNIVRRISNKIINRIKAQPTADVQEVRHGKWIPYEIDLPKFNDEKIVNYTCSECGRRLIGYSNPKDAPYCHCGAKMDKE